MSELGIERAKLRRAYLKSALGKIYYLAKDWQAALVGIIGFVGVGLTIAGQFRVDHLEQKAHQRQEANQLRVALAAELHSYAGSYRNSAENLAHGINVVFSAAPEDIVFEHSLDKIGLLTDDEIRVVYTAYYQQNQYTPILTAGCIAFSVPGYFTVRADNFKSVANIFSNFSRYDAFASEKLLAHVKRR